MLTSSRVWLNHFEYHARQLRGAAAGEPGILTPAERRLIARSLATFQLGEQSTGAGLKRAACRFAAAHGDELLPAITDLFIREEQRHAELLRQFMDEQGIATRRHCLADTLLRRARRDSGFETYLHVLVAAELIGNVYYHALAAATDCQRLRVLCRTLLADELAHIGYQSELIRAMRARRSTVSRMMLRLAHRSFFFGAACLVWIGHRAVLRGAGHTAATFLRECLGAYAFHLEPPAAWSARVVASGWRR